MPSPSLVQSVRQRYLECVTSVQPASGWKLLILDQETQSRIQSLLKMYDILEQGVQQVELITNQRSAFPRLEAIYILEPTPENVQRLARDFEPARPAQAATKKAPAVPASSGPKYAAAHVFFTDSLDDRDVELLANGPAGAYLRTLKEIYVDFTPLEAQVFSIQYPDSFWTLYSPTAHKYREAMDTFLDALNEMATSMLNVCATLNEFPDIRYYAPEALGRPILGPNSKQHLTKTLAGMVDAKLKEYARDNADFQALAESRNRGTLLITDRSMDLQAPFLHEFTYQAMCNDLLPIEDGTRYHHRFRNEQGRMEEVNATLSDDDKTWVQIRHMHMKDALDCLVEEFRLFNAEHGSTGGSSINDLKDMLANLPTQKDSKEKLSLHLSLAEQCMTIFEERKLPISASVEQSCATGMSAEGKAPKTIVEEMVPLLDDRSVSREDKVRIIALYVMFRDGVPEEDRKRLYQHARLGMTEIDAVNHLVHLGQEVSKEAKSKKKTVFKQVLRDDAYDISRYQPALKLMLEEHIGGKLDRNVFPYVNPPTGPAAAGPSSGSLRSGGAKQSAPTAAPTSLRSARPRWTAGTKTKALNEPRQKLMVFVAGGMTYSEIRSAYQVSEANNKDVYIGSSHVIVPEDFIEELATIERPSADKRGSRARDLLPPTDPGRAPSAGSSRPGPSRQPQQPVASAYPASSQQAAGGSSRNGAGSSAMPSDGSSGGRYGQWQEQRGSTGSTPSSHQNARPPAPSSTQSYNSAYSSSVAHDDFVPNIKPSRPSGPAAAASSSSLKPGPPLSAASSVASTGTPDKPKKKGLFSKFK